MPIAVRPPRLSGLVEIVAWMAAAGFLSGFLGKIWWIFDLCSHFRVQYAGTLFLCTAFFAVTRRKKPALTCLPVAMGITLMLMPWFPSSPALPTGAQRFKIISFNVNTANSRHHEVRDYLLKQDADFVFLMEVNEDWLNDLQDLERKYPFHLKSPRDDNFGVAVYSRLPLAGEGLVEFGPAEIPAVDLRTEVLGATYRLVGIHTLPPISAQHFQMRNEELISFAKSAASSEVPSILFGDFNLTPFSPWFATILRTSKLSNTAAGRICSPTWMRIFPPFALPIDQCLIPSTLALAERSIGPSCGSDHNALVITLGLAKER
jgi:endonuclease/exonuclease/phosphatase (EEP) superfamily protein YafD